MMQNFKKGVDTRSKGIGIYQWNQQKKQVKWPLKS